MNDGVAAVSGEYAPWDVVRIDFPYADQIAVRRRPALVVGVHQVDQRFAVLWVLMITSAKHRMWPHDVAISDLQAAGLSQSCVVRAEKIATVDARFAARIGQLAVSDRASVAQHLRSLLGGVLSG